MRLIAANGRRLELQFHTRPSYEAAKATRGLYEELRMRSTSDERLAELRTLIDAAFTAVPIPPSALP